jgi:hypothetical protein
VESDQWSALSGMERNRPLFSVRCAPDSPVHPLIEGNQGLPNEDQMTPWSLRAIKGPPRCHGAGYKHTLSNLHLLNSAAMLSIH